MIDLVGLRIGEGLMIPSLALAFLDWRVFLSETVAWHLARDRTLR